jgi:hypothetical protein
MHYGGLWNYSVISTFSRYPNVPHFSRFKSKACPNLLYNFGATAWLHTVLKPIALYQNRFLDDVISQNASQQK